MAAASSQYRPIAVTVEARADGFRWQLLESADGSSWDLLSSARKSLPHYSDAMAAGLLALQALTPDLDAGPQRDVDQATEPSSEADEAGEEAPEPKKRGGAFGFGGLR
ncbi:MAG: hypothetical protein EOP77_06505 [Variovorax sp.]|nr:MAG: hypothetical protein EOP77_06505 [Variovorax sp.]